MRAAGFIVPPTFEDLPQVLKETYDKLVAEGSIQPKPEVAPPQIPIDYKWAQELGMVRKPAAFISTISDERGQELLYAGMPISQVFEEDIGIGGVLSLLWFKRRLPSYATKFLEMVLMLTADHGPAVSGAMTTSSRPARQGPRLVARRRPPHHRRPLRWRPRRRRGRVHARVRGGIDPPRVCRLDAQGQQAHPRYRPQDQVQGQPVRALFFLFPSFFLCLCSAMRRRRLTELC